MSQVMKTDVDIALIRKRRTQLDTAETLLANAIQQLENTCHHPTPFMKYRGDTGNYDKLKDSYWIEWTCPDCRKQWTTDQSRESIQQYPKAIVVK